MRKFYIFVVSRIIKIFANITKVSCYVFHFFFPNKRFILPERAGPLFGSNKPYIIARTLWQTNFTDRVTLPVYLNYLFNRLMSPTFEYRFMVTEERERFIKSSYPAEIYATYSKLQIGAAQADFWRLLVLQKYGGVYMDIDAHLVWPLGFILGTHLHELYIKTKGGEITNYFIASERGNPHLEQMIDVIVDNIENSAIKNIYLLTGPGVFNQVLKGVEVSTRSYRYTCNQGNFTNEYFQYIDKPQGKWTREQEKIDIVKR